MSSIAGFVSVSQQKACATGPIARAGAQGWRCHRRQPLLGPPPAGLGDTADRRRPDPRRRTARLRAAFGKAKPKPDDDLLRDLADYDRAFGVDLNDADRGEEVAR